MHNYAANYKANYVNGNQALCTSIFFLSFSSLIITPQGGLTVSQFLSSWLIYNHLQDSATG